MTTGNDAESTESNLTPISQRINVKTKVLAEFCCRNHIRKLAFFGSVLRDDFRRESDIDVLVEFEPGKTPGFGMIDIEDELTKLAGRKVGLRTPQDLRRYFRDQVVREARSLYVAA
jgi:uncharacterized protein